MPDISKIAVIIVTHNSQATIDFCLQSLFAQELLPQQVVVVDSGSFSHDYLQPWVEQGVKVVCKDNCGFAKANNYGLKSISGNYDYVLFLNPDVILNINCLVDCISYVKQLSEPACFGVKLLGWDKENNCATGLLDSSGVFRKWYGRWYDRGQGKPDILKGGEAEKVPAVCGAFLFVGRDIVERVSLAENVFFDPDFFLYKEDIELCLRIRNRGFNVYYVPWIESYHCRGWQERREMSASIRLMAAKSELLLYKKHPSVYMLWAWAKYLLVRFAGL